jgi:hypothetical protein
MRQIGCVVLFARAAEARAQRQPRSALARWVAGAWGLADTDARAVAMRWFARETPTPHQHAAAALCPLLPHHTAPQTQKSHPIVPKSQKKKEARAATVVLEAMAAGGRQPGGRPAPAPKPPKPAGPKMAATRKLAHPKPHTVHQRWGWLVVRAQGRVTGGLQQQQQQGSSQGLAHAQL